MLSARWMGLVAGVALAGCASLAAENPTRPPAGRPSAEIVRDEAACAAYANGQARHKGDHYRACMLARGYAVNMELDDLGWIIGLIQTRSHEPGAVIEDMTRCDSRADNAKNADRAPPLTPEQERSLAGQTFVFSQQRPNATRVLVACLHERGYAIAPWVPINAPR